MNKIKYNLTTSNTYLIKTNNEFISDVLIEENSLRSIIINTLSKTQKPLLLPIYIEKKKKILIKELKNKFINVGDIDLLRFIIDNETLEYDWIFFGLTGLSREGVSFLKEYLPKVSKNKSKTFVLIDYDSQYREIEKILISP